MSRKRVPTILISNSMETTRLSHARSGTRASWGLRRNPHADRVRLLLGDLGAEQIADDAAVRAGA
jgi:hypothetical protein